jgi:hypothetical protein
MDAAGGARDLGRAHPRVPMRFERESGKGRDAHGALGEMREQRRRDRRVVVDDVTLGGPGLPGRAPDRGSSARSRRPGTSVVAGIT